MVRERENLIIGRPRTFKTNHLRAEVNCKVLENNYILSNSTRTSKLRIKL